MVQIRVQLEGDADGYLKRQCPHCGVEFKILWSRKEKGEAHICPSCGYRGSFLRFSTPEQKRAMTEALQTTLFKRLSMQKGE